MSIYDRTRTDYERVEDAYSRGWVLCMGTRCPTKHKLVDRFYGYLVDMGNDNLVPLDDSEIINSIPDFVEYLGSI